MTALLPFLLNSLLPRVADPGNPRFFLPAVLETLPGSNSAGKLLPLEEDAWDLGPIGGNVGETITQSFAANWSTYLERMEGEDLGGQQAIAPPGNPAPSLSLGGAPRSIRIGGLRNLRILGAPDYEAVAGGYAIALTMEFDHWDGTGGRPDLPRLGLSAPFTMRQALCLADTGGTVCNGRRSTDIAGHGTVSARLTGAYLDLLVHVTAPRDAGGAFGTGLVVSVERVTMRGADAATLPGIEVDDLTIEADFHAFLLNFWRSQITAALTSPDGVSGILGNINTALARPGNRAALAGEVTKNLAAVLDDLFAPVSGGLAPSSARASVNEADRYLFDRLRHALGRPASRLFLPRLLAQGGSPGLEPLHIAKVPLPDIRPDPRLTFTDCHLTGLTVTGLSNARGAETAFDLDGDAMRFEAEVGGWSPAPVLPGGPAIPAPPARGAADFSITPKGERSAITGSIAMTAQAVQLSGRAVATGTSDGDLVITLTGLRLSARDLSRAIRVTVRLDSWFAEMINAGANSPGVLDGILGALNDALKDQLAALSRDITRHAREAIASELR